VPIAGNAQANKFAPGLLNKIIGILKC